MKIAKEKFGEIDGKSVCKYTLENELLRVSVIEYGAIIQSMIIKTAAGERELALGFNTLDGYVKAHNYYGATVGRVANRIENATFELNGKTYTLDRNNGKNCLHGGFSGYNRRVFAGAEKDGGVEFTLPSPDGDQGFPGNLTVTVTYKLIGDTLKIGISGLSDADTLFAPTNHTYFNITGGEKSIFDTELAIYADHFTPVDPALIPTGEKRAVVGTPFDFTAPKPIGRDINAKYDQIEIPHGYDHNFILRGEHVATAKHDGVTVDIYSDLPGVQFYTANTISATECRGKGGDTNGAFCLEPQYFPNAINSRDPEVAKPILRAGKKVDHYINYKFSC